MDGCTDGTFTTTGEKYFTCTFGHGLYFPLASLRPDERFGLQAGHAASSLGNRECALTRSSVYMCMHVYTYAHLHTHVRLVWPPLPILKITARCVQHNFCL